MQYLDSRRRLPPPSPDAHLVGSEDLLLPAMLLDYMYGAAAYNLWKSDPDSVHEGIL